MKYLITYHWRPEIAEADSSNQGSFTEIVEDVDLEEFLEDGMVVITMFEKVGPDTVKIDEL